MKKLAWMTALSTALLAAAPAPQIVKIVPSVADPAVKQFDEPSIAIADPALPRDAALAVFLTGSFGKPENTMPMLQTIAGQGYRVIGLEYNDAPAVMQVCARAPEPDCSAKFRELRAFGTGSFAAIPNTPAEAIVPRLVAALRWLDRQQPKVGWGDYLNGDQPRWNRITVGGLSQGAGMAAYIAKRYPLRRVVLFSSPWDFTGTERRPAPWLALPGATPMDRWQAAYNQRENTVPLIRAAYTALAIPADHVCVFNLELPTGMQPNGPNPYHPIGIRDVRYRPQWQAMFGRGS